MDALVMLESECAAVLVGPVCYHDNDCFVRSLVDFSSGCHGTRRWRAMFHHRGYLT